MCGIRPHPPQPSYKKTPSCGTEQSGGEVPRSPNCHLSTYRAIEPPTHDQRRESEDPLAKACMARPAAAATTARTRARAPAQTQLLCVHVSLFAKARWRRRTVFVCASKGDSGPSADRGRESVNCAICVADGQGSSWSLHVTTAYCGCAAKICTTSILAENAREHRYTEKEERAPPQVG